MTKKGEEKKIKNVLIIKVLYGGSVFEKEKDLNRKNFIHRNEKGNLPSSKRKFIMLKSMNFVLYYINVLTLRG